ncbi:CxxH/CxxC protein, BA_5709 family [Bhargavaea ginsengi]|uniref:CxxH/CxxC protein, BA_5709 family n=1 Tax=Bhargavaea ginsengi TaxID=426757 RepID=A0A1H6ZTZ8_9BACL|nr:CxxH/CxxC protein [Bhargavaea ginsengi]SEJ55664.1 CxxH/CxxC protein, BA_5709 family [Bhargavaea ginsengi]
METVTKKACETHVYRALDEVTAETEAFPIMETMNKGEELSTSCDFCQQAAVYVVSNMQSPPIS